MPTDIGSPLMVVIRNLLKIKFVCNKVEFIKVKTRKSQQRWAGWATWLGWTHTRTVASPLCPRTLVPVLSLSFSITHLALACAVSGSWVFTPANQTMLHCFHQLLEPHSERREGASFPRPHLSLSFPWGSPRCPHSLQS